jgi:hypothetical protein
MRETAAKYYDRANIHFEELPEPCQRRLDETRKLAERYREYPAEEKDTGDYEDI